MKILILLLPILLFSENNTTLNDNNSIDESFLLEIEYGKLLYKNPRGISCEKCHGKKGRGGKKIAKYYDKFQNPKILKGIDIRGYSFKDLKASLENRYKIGNRIKRHKIMPKYYLTDKEIRAIYLYLKEKD